MTDTPTSSDTQFNQTFTHHTASVNGINLHYVMGGEGDPVVLLHGWPLTWRSWRKIMPALAEHYTVIAPDLRGMGDSEKPPTGYDKRTVAQDIYELVHSLGYKSIFLVGHDMGAPVAYTYAAEHPEDVRRLVILDVPMNGFGLDEFARKLGFWHMGFHQTPELPEKLTAGREREYITWFYQTVTPGAITSEDIEEYVRCYSAPGAMRAGFEHYRAFPVDEQRFQEYSKNKLPMPVLAVGGEFCGGPFPFYSLAQLALNARGGVINNCGHFIADEQPEQLKEQLLSFFGEDVHVNNP